MRKWIPRAPRRSSSLWATFAIVRALTHRLALATFLAGIPALAHADQLSAEQHDGERGYVAVEELSYETIVDASNGYSATLRVRTAMHNSSRSARDTVASFALPRSLAPEQRKAICSGNARQVYRF